MCYNVEIFLSRDSISKRFDVVVPQKIDYRPNYYLNAFDFPDLPVIRNDRPDELDLIKWGLIPHWVTDSETAGNIQSKTHNARGETIFSKNSFKKGAQSHRCLIIIHGFYEWQHRNGKKIPHYIFSHDNEPMAVAGLFDTWNNPETGKQQDTISLVTTNARGVMKKIHNSKLRMPAILKREYERQWIDNKASEDDLKEMLNNEINDLLNFHTISSRISNPKTNKNIPEIIEKYDYPEQGSLF